MEIPDSLYSLFSATVREHDDSYTVEIPKQEIEGGPVEPGRTYCVGLLGDSTTPKAPTEKTTTDSHPAEGLEQPPVLGGERRTVDIEGIGDQGDGIARIESGYVIIVPNTEKGERVTVQVTYARENVAFAEVIERHHHHS